MKTDFLGRIGFLALMAAATGCAASREYQCPQPIGLIIRDDCEAYRNRYEATRVGLSAGGSQFKLQAEFSEQALRDPSEFVQVMNQRLMGLCHDFNACRLSADEYRRRRDEIDNTMTALAALGEQLRRPDLSADERKLLLGRLVELLGGGTARPAPTPATPASPPAQAEEKKYSFYSSDAWFESRFSPPQAPPARPGLPRLVHPWGEFVIENAWVPRSPSEPHHMKLDGYRPRPRATLWGKLEADDVIEFVLPGNENVSCPVRVSHDGVRNVGCETPKNWQVKTPSFQMEVLYRPGGQQETISIGKLSGRVLEGREGGFEEDHEARVGEGWLYFAPHPPYLPADCERPHIYVTLRLRKYEREVTARCFAGEKSVTGAMKPERGSGQTGTHMDRPRYEQIDEHSSRSVAEPFVEWWHYVFALPFAAPHEKGKSCDLPPWPPESGELKCVVKIGEQPVRELFFEVDKEGRPKPLPGQQGKPGDMVTPWWKVRTRVVPNQAETTVEWPVRS